MKVLVTGAAGFIGSQVTRVLVQRGAEVHALVRPNTRRDRLEPVADRVSLVTADLDDPAAVEAAVHQVSPDGCIHAAWYVEPGRYLHAVPENLAALEASNRLLRLLLSAGCERVVLVGTSFEPAAGGERGGVEPPQESIYRAAKAALHTVGQRLADEGNRVACAHVFYLYGPGEDGRRLVPLLIRSLLRGERIAVTDGQQRRDYLHVADIAAGLCTILEQGASGSLDVSSGTPTPLGELFRLLGDATGRSELIEVGGRPYGEGEVLVAEGDDRALRALGWAPERSLEEGIKETVAWWAARLGDPGSGAGA